MEMLIDGGLWNSPKDIYMSLSQPAVLICYAGPHLDSPGRLWTYSQKLDLKKRTIQKIMDIKKTQNKYIKTLTNT